MTKISEDAAARTPVGPQEAEQIRGQIFATLTTLIEMASLRLPTDRASAIAVTKMDEARLWLMHPALVSEVHKKAAEEAKETVNGSAGNSSS